MLSDPEVIVSIHGDYIQAGADLLTANTFRTNARTFTRAGLTLRDARRATTLAVDCARRAIANSGTHRRILVAGSLAPVEDCYRPDLVPPPAELAREHRDLAQWLADAGVDVILVETMNRIREARIAVQEAVRTRVEVWASLLCHPHQAAALYSGEPLADAVAAVADAGCAAVGVNCVPAERTESLVALVSASSALPVMAYANGGRADDDGGWRPDATLTPARYGELARTWWAAGAAKIGGCCGTHPGHIEAVRALADSASRTPGAGPQ